MNVCLDDVSIERATAADVEGILALDGDTIEEQGGPLSRRLDRDGVLAALVKMPGIVARRHGRVVGFLLSWEKSIGHPVAQAMLEAYPGGEDSYVYGPICVDMSVRGRGIAAAMFAALRRLLPGREGILFIRADNRPSLRAHRKMDMREVAGFTHEGADFLVFAYRG